MLTKHREELKSSRTNLLMSVHVDEQLLSYLVADYIIGISVKEEIIVSNRWLLKQWWARHIVGLPENCRRKIDTRKVAVVNALQLEGCPMTCQSFWSVFGQYYYCTCTQTAIYWLPVKILKSLLDSATQISYRGAVIWRPDDVFTLWPRSLTLDLDLDFECF